MTPTQLIGGTCSMKLGNTELRANPLTDLDYAELDEYVQDEIIKIAKRNKISMPDALRAALGLRWNSDDGAKVIASKIGTFRVGYQMVKRQHHLSFDEFVKIANENVDQAIEEIDLVFTRLNTDQSKDDKEPEKNVQRAISP